MKLAPRRALRALLALPLWLAVPASTLQASGFAIENQGARAMGLAGAYVAQAADPSAIFYNAGGVGFLKGRQLYVSAGFGILGTDFTGEGPNPPAGTLERTNRRFLVLPSFYYTHQVSERLVVGLGFNAPFGFRSQWENPDEFSGRFLCVDCEVRSWGLNPTLAFKVADRLSLGAGLDLRFANFKLNQRVLADPSPFPKPTDVAEQTIESSTDTGVGFNVGLLARPSETVSIGLSYRHKVSASFEGTATFRQIQTGDPVVDGIVGATLPARQAVLASFYFPASIAAGIAVHRGNWTVEGDLVFTLWSVFDRVRLTYPETPALDRWIAQDYEDVLQGRLGIEYLLSETWALRAGYSYDRSPQPTETIGPFLHDEDRHGFGLGATWKYENVKLDLVGRYLLFSSRSTDGLSISGFEGLYETSGFQLGVALGYRF